MYLTEEPLGSTVLRLPSTTNSFDLFVCVTLLLVPFCQILADLAHADIDWTKCKIYFADERCVPLDHKDRLVAGEMTQNESKETITVLVTVES